MLTYIQKTSKEDYCVSQKKNWVLIILALLLIPTMIIADRSLKDLAFAHEFPKNIDHITIGNESIYRLSLVQEYNAIQLFKTLLSAERKPIIVLPIINKSIFAVNGWCFNFVLRDGNSVKIKLIELYEKNRMEYEITVPHGIAKYYYFEFSGKNLLEWNNAISSWKEK
jgi:hypothetical protein